LCYFKFDFETREEERKMFDVLFIGSGQGAWNGAIPMSQMGLKVAVVESGQFGGVCTNRGCNAKITLDQPVELVQTIRQLQGRGFDTVPTINWPDLMAHKQEVIGKLAESNKQKLIDAGVTVIIGHRDPSRSNDCSRE
jgi:glutathione reductase (NADPH)